MAETLLIDVVDKSVPVGNTINIAVINQPNPVKEFAATGRQIFELIQIPKYFITDSATKTQITGWNFYQYFPDLAPGGGGGGGGGAQEVIAHSTAEWATIAPSMVSKYGLIYIYTDYSQDSEGRDIPAFKVGNGNAYVSDLAFFEAQSTSPSVIAHTVEEWETIAPVMVSKYGMIYIYTDYAQTPDGKDLPALKVGNGNAYVSDLAFFTASGGDQKEYIISKTKEEWAQIETTTVSVKDVMYVYSNYDSHEGKSIPATKIGDGVSTIANLPFMYTVDASQPYITYEDVDRWNDKVSAKYSGGGELDPDGTLLLYPTIP